MFLGCTIIIYTEVKERSGFMKWSMAKRVFFSV